MPSTFLRWLSALVLVLGFATESIRAGEAIAVNRPNVLFIAVDDLNDWVGLLGGHPQAKTPNLDRLLARGTYFTNAHCNAPVCAASRHSLLSGLRPTTTGWYDNVSQMREIQQNWQDVLRDTVPLPQYFKNHGYDVRGGGKIYHNGPADFAADQLWDQTLPAYPWPDGFHNTPWKYAPMFGPMPRDGGGIFTTFGTGGHSLCWGALKSDEIPGNLMPDERTANWAIDQLSDSFKRPFFLAVGFVRPHVPYTAPARYFEPFDIDAIEAPDEPSGDFADIPIYGKAMAHDQMIDGGDHPAVLGVSDTYWRELIRGYLACVSMVDDQIGRVIAALDASPHKDATIVVLWSDHGQHLGEKRSWRKMTLWEQATKVPLSIAAPGIARANQPCSRPVSLVDLYPTLIELCGLPKIDALEGRSLVPLLHQAQATWETPAVTTWHYGNHSVRSDRWRYTQYRDATEELYDHDRDPQEWSNVAGDPRNAEVLAWHRQWIPARQELPNRDRSYKGDKYDELVEQWQSEGGPPQWLK